MQTYASVCTRISNVREPHVDSVRLLQVRGVSLHQFMGWVFGLSKFRFQPRRFPNQRGQAVCLLDTFP